MAKKTKKKATPKTYQAKIRATLKKAQSLAVKAKDWGMAENIGQLLGE